MPWPEEEGKPSRTCEKSSWLHGTEITGRPKDGGKWYEWKKKGDNLASASYAAKASSSTASTPSDGWTVIPAVDIPEMFNYGSLYHYLVESIAEFGITYDHDSDKEYESDIASGYKTTEKPFQKKKTDNE